MADLISTRARIFTCLAKSSALDQLGGAPRTAPDEAMIVVADGDAEASASDARRTLATVDPAALVIDTTDGWEGLTLAGDGARDVFAHLSELELPAEGFRQGDVGRLAAKIFCRSGRITMFVPSPQAAYLRQRILALGASESEPEDWKTS